LGTVRLKVDAATTAALTAGDYVYDLEITAPNGDVTRLVEGKFKVKPEVTR
jgi:microcompartment protein CcmL/EutN